MTSARPARPTALGELLDILVCPEDRGPLLLIGDQMLYNPRLRRAYRIDDGIPVLLIEEARAVDEDEHARLTAGTDPAAPR
ncbi:MAG TPA: Trm112 family protein [Mycobacterium sp.]|nr:Trm112 family protein [Mycobacterium sp.]